MMEQAMMNVKDTPRGEGSLGMAYTHPQPKGPVSLTEYLLTRGETRTYLLLKWQKDTPYPVDGFRYVLEQVDGGGRVLTVSEHECRRVPRISEGETFIPDEGMAVLDRCADIRVKITEVRSEGYVYRLAGNAYEVDFESDVPWVYEKSRKKPDGLTPKKSLRVRSKRLVHGRFLWLGGLLTTLILVNVLIMAAYGPVILRILESIFEIIRELLDIVVNLLL